jgi:hypothetical protein
MTSSNFASAKPFLLGAAGGAILLAIVGFTWGGWVSGGTADKMASQRADAAVVQALAPICVQNFRVQIDAATQLVTLQKLSSYEQRGFVEKGGWAAIPGTTEVNPAVARACADALSKLSAADLT